MNREMEEEIERWKRRIKEASHGTVIDLDAGVLRHVGELLAKFPDDKVLAILRSGKKPKGVRSDD